MALVLGMFVPMIGLIQVGSQARADRYTYLPMIGLYILVTWGAIELFGKWRHRREVLAVAALLILTSLVARSYGQASFWQNYTTLWSHAIEITSRNYLAHDNLGNAFLLKGQLKEAVDQYDKALEIDADYPEAHSNLGVALFQMGEHGKAFYNFQEALRLDPNYAGAYINYGNALFETGKIADSVEQYKRAVALAPDLFMAHNDLGAALFSLGDKQGAIEQFQEALRLKPDFEQARQNLESCNP
jgi:tetratricopeptide (TPR) repeat protein